MHHLVGTHEVAELLGVSRQRVHQLAAEADFPEPEVVLKGGTVWRRAAIEEWRDSMRSTSSGVVPPQVPSRDPERPQDDPWDANAVRYLLRQPERRGWTRGALMECLREQPNRRRKEPERVAEATRLAQRYGVERHPDAGGKTIHFFRTDRDAPRPYPTSAAERRAWLAEEA